MKASPLVIPDRDTARRKLPERFYRLMRPATTMVTGPAARKGLISVADQAMLSAASFLTSVIVARATSRAELGIYYLALTLVLLARGVQAQLFTAPYVVYCQRRQGRELAAYTGSVLIHQLLFAALVTACFGGLGGLLWLGLGPADLAPAVGVLVAAAPILLFHEFGRHYWLCHLKVTHAMAFDAATAVLQLGILGLLWRFGWLSVPAVYVGMGIAGGVVGVGWLVVERGRWQIDRARLASDWRANWSFARWALLSHLVGSTTPQVMPWIVAATAGKGAAGLYGACATLSGVANMFVTGLGNLVSPKAARVYAEEGSVGLCRVLGKAAAVFGLVVGSLCLAALAIGEEVLVFVYGGQYAGGGMILAVCMASVLATSLGVVAGNGLWAIERPQATLVPDLCALTLSVGTAALLVGPLGPLGAALAMLLGTAAGSAAKGASFLRWIRSSAVDRAGAKEGSGEGKDGDRSEQARS